MLLHGWPIDKVVRCKLRSVFSFRKIGRDSAMPGLFARLLSRGADKQLKELRALADRVGTLEPTFHALSDDDLRG